MFDDLYLDGEEDEETSQSIRPGFGYQALDKYLTDDAHGQISWKWRQHFHEGKSFPYTLDSKASDDDLIFMMKSAIRHYGRQAMEQISQRKKGDVNNLNFKILHIGLLKHTRVAINIKKQ